MQQATTGKRELNRLNNRNAILDAARACFREQGYDRVTIRDIIRRTNLASGTFYNYFSDKRDIFAALLQEFINRSTEILHELRRSASTPEDYVLRTYLALFQGIAEDPAVYELIHRSGHTVRSLFGDDVLGQAMRSLNEDTERAIASGVLPKVDSELLSAAFFGVAYELGLKVAQREPANPEEAAKFATNLFVGGLERIARQQASTKKPAAVSAHTTEALSIEA